VTALLAMACGLAIPGLRWITRTGVEIHQRAVTREVTEWGNEYVQIKDDASAVRAAEMVGYIEAYYPVGDGYHGSDESERELETARANSLRQLINALEVYTGNQFGDDHLAWSRWADFQRRGEPSDAPQPRNEAF